MKPASEKKAKRAMTKLTKSGALKELWGDYIHSCGIARDNEDGSYYIRLVAHKQIPSEKMPPSACDGVKIKISDAPGKAEPVSG